MPSPAAQAAAHRAAVTLATPQGFAPALARALAALLPSLGLRRAEELLARGASRALVESLDWEAFERELMAAVEGHAPAISQALLKSAAKPLAIDLTPETLARYSDEIAKVHAAEFVTAISKRDRRALRETIRRAVSQQGVHRRLLAREIRGMIGLNRPQQRSLAKLSAKWLEQVEAGTMSRARYAQQVDRARRRMLRQRADLIAGHEARSLAQRSQDRTYRAAEAQGVPIIGLGEPFIARDGSTWPGPPRHIRCDCTQTTVIRDGVIRVMWVAGPRWCPTCDPLNGALRGGGHDPAAIATQPRPATRRVRRSRPPRPIRRPPPPLTEEQLEVRYQKRAREIQQGWVHGSRNKRSIQAQEAIRRELGLDVALFNPKGWLIDERLVDEYRPIVRRMYQETQASLPRGFVRLYRGSNSSKETLRGVLESWADELNKALKFARQAGQKNVLTIEIDTRQIFLYRGGPNWMDSARYGNQREWVVLGRRPK